MENKLLETVLLSSETTTFAQMLVQTAERHSHLCPRQVLGVRIGLLASRVLNLNLPESTHNLVTLIETDGCASDGISVATGCTVGNRRLRVLDYGKVAATFVDTRCGRAIRIVPRKGIREAAQRQIPQAKSRWHAQLQAYQIFPDMELLVVQRVKLTISLKELLSKPGCRVLCESCGEEVINQREVHLNSKLLCRSCAGQSYYYLEGTDNLIS